MIALAAASMQRSITIEVRDRRRELLREQPDGMETWTAADPSWRGRIEDLHTDVQESLTGAQQTDPRAALIDLMAACWSLVDEMDGIPRA